MNHSQSQGICVEPIDVHFVFSVGRALYHLQIHVRVRVHVVRAESDDVQVSAIAEVETGMAIAGVTACSIEGGKVAEFLSMSSLPVESPSTSILAVLDRHASLSPPISLFLGLRTTAPADRYTACALSGHAPGEAVQLGRVDHPHSPFVFMSTGVPVVHLYVSAT